MSNCSYRLWVFATLVILANIFAYSYLLQETPPKAPMEVVKAIPTGTPVLPPRATKEPAREAVPVSLHPERFAMYLRSPIFSAIQASPFDLIIMDPEFIGKDKKRTPFSSKQVAELRHKKTVVAYLNVGEAERYRDYWSELWERTPPKWMGKESLHWKGVYAIRDVSHQDWETIVKKRIDSLVSAGYSGMLLGGLHSYREDMSDKSRQRMINWVIEISEYAKAKDPSFVVLVEDAEELLANDTYLKAIDGIVKQNLFHTWKANGVTGPKTSDDERKRSIAFLRKAKTRGKAVLVVEYVKDKAWEETKPLIKREGFLGYSAPKQLNALRLDQ